MMNLSHASLPCNLSMEKLVDSVGSKFIFGYLEKTLGFLTSNDKEFHLPKLLPSKEEFLQRIAKDHSYLYYPVFNEECRKVIAAITTVLDLNKNVFRWSCAYRNRTANETYLVYTKQYFVLPSSKISDRLKLRLGPAPTPPNTTCDVATNSKITFLNTTLKFIKDGDRLFLRYPEMTVPEVNYFRKLLESPSMDEDVGPGFKSLYSTLWDAMKKFSLKFEFQIDVVETSKCYGCLVLHKVPKCKKTITQKDSSANIAPTQAYTSKQPTNCLNNHQIKRLKHKTQLLQNLSVEFIDHSLHSLLEFIEDESRRQIVYENLSNDEAMFYQSVRHMSQKDELLNLFEHDHKVVLRVINRLLTSVYRLQLSMEQKRMPGKGPLFMITCIKERNQNKKSKQNVTDSSCSLQSSGSKNSCVDVAPKKQRARQKETQINVKSTLPVNKRDRSVSSNRALRSKSAINFNSGGIINPNSPSNTINNSKSTVNDKSIDNQKATDKKAEEMNIKTSMYSRRHQKILEDMSVPLESDKATRMMRLMGWEGGALGARGEGITVPILPAFPIKSGAGLGHVPPPPKPATKTKPTKTKPPIQLPQKTNPFRVNFLRYIAKLIFDDCAKLVIKLENNIVKKQQTFVREIIDAFNGRSKIVLRDETEVDLVLKITDAMENSPNLRLSVNICSIKRELTIKKDIVALTQSKNKPETVHRDTSSGMSKNGASRRLLLIKILELLQSNQKSKEFHTDWLMKNGDVKTFNDIVVKINDRIPVSVNAQEYIIFNDIMCCIGDLDIEIMICSSFKKFVLKKVFNGSRPTYASSTGTIQAAIKNKSDSVLANEIVNDIEILSDDEVTYVHIQNEVVEIYDSDTDVENNIKETNNNIETTEAVDATLIQNVNTHEMTKDCDKNEEIGVIEKVTDQSLSNNTQNNVEKCVTTRVNASDMFKKELNSNIAIELPSNDCAREHEDIKKETVSETENNVEANTSLNHSAIAKELSDLEMAIKKSGLSEPNLTIKNEDSKVNKTNTIKRTRTESNNGLISKKPKNDYPKLVCIKPCKDTIPIDMAKEIQMKINENIFKSPLLQCHGLIVGYVIYACYGQNSLELIEAIAKDLNYEIEDFDTFQIDKVFTVEMKMRCYFDFNVLEALNLFYKDLNIDNWKVLHKRNVNEFVFIHVDIDGASIELIADCNFTLHVGVDRVQFTLIGGKHKSCAKIY